MFGRTVYTGYLYQISTQKKKIDVIAPKRFVQRVKKEHELFCGYMHQDAHEFLNFLLNKLFDILEKETKGTKEHSSPPEKIPNGIHVPLANGVRKETLVTWVHKNFQGILTNETKCLRCETVTARDETLLDLSLDIEQNNSITSCLKNFSSTETLNAEDKFFCDKCCSLQEAQKRMKIKKQPHILVIHVANMPNLKGFFSIIMVMVYLNQLPMSYTRYIPLPISNLDSWLKTPSIYVFDCSAAGMIANAFIEDWTPSSSYLGTSPRDCILLAACEAHEKVMNRIPGRQTDRKKLLGELNWRSSAFIDYSLDCSPVSYPMLPPNHQQHMWDAWDMAAEIAFHLIVLLYFILVMV
ncbi:unnamed protein product [Lactuca saligna]|uniref:USP domain-containing protein n=1 Tax=Lactuca saligna TaxID=75948 RepID=A0AA35VCE2_LACSI|nr:unnamed protein product [Lactuca saligna]